MEDDFIVTNSMDFGCTRDLEVEQWKTTLQNAFENAIYISNEQKVGNRITLEYGLRGSMFHVMGPGTVYDFDDSGNISNETIYGDWEVIKT